MDENKIKEAIRQVLENENLDITKLLTSEERTEILQNSYKYFKDNDYEKIKYKLFTKEEAEITDELSNILNSNKKRIIELDVHLSDERKLEILKTTEKNFQYNYTELIKSIEQDEIKKQALLFILENNDSYFWVKYTDIIISFKNIDESIKTIDDFLEKNPESRYKILSINLNLETIFKNLPKEQYKKILKILDKYECIQEFKILNGIDNKLEIFEEIIKLPNYRINHNALYDLISHLNENDSFSAFNILMNNNYERLKNIEIIELIKKTSKDRKKEFLDILYDEIELKDLEIIISNYIRALPKEERRIQFKEYIINNDKFNSLKIAASLVNETMLNCLDEAIIEKNKELNSELEKKDLTKKIIVYLENLNYDIECNINEVNCNTLLKQICKYESLNEENLKTIINKFGYQILKYINYENIKDLINLNQEDLNKILYMFKEENLTIDTHKKDSIIESVIQREFMFLESYSYNIFSTFETLINKQDSKLKQTFDEVINTVFEKRPKNLQKICKENNITIQELYENIKIGTSIDILHQITQQYIEIEREEYSKIRTPEFIKQLDLDKKFKKEWILKKYIELQDIGTIKYKIRNINAELTEEQENLKNNNEQLEYIIEFKKNPSKELMDKIEKKNLKIFNELLNKLYELNELNNIPKEEEKKAEYIYSFKKVKEQYLIEILSQLDINCIKEKVLSETEIYQKLLQLLDKHKYLGYGTTFQPVAQNIDLEIGSQSIAGLINCFYKLYNESTEKTKFIEQHTMTKLLEEGFCHELTSNKYATIIGEEDFKLIFSNTGKNRASATAQARLNNVLEIIPKMYEKEYLTIPPLNEIIKLKNGKQIKVEIGQPLDFTNLSVGERTNACLRSKGAFRDLWEFILTNKNGFNIIFKTPNDKFISRVSGIRNGNTIFENELRDSVLNEYTNEDLIEANQIVTTLLENYTKTSEYPIENIIITNDYAMEKEKEKLQPITTDRKEAMYGLNFNYDKNDTFEGIILSNNGNLKEIKLGKDNTEEYKINKNIKIYYNEEALKKINQLHALNQLLNGIPIEDIVINNQKYNSENISCITNNEYYILKYNDEIIETFILDKYKQNEITQNIIKNETEEQHENSRNYH